MRNIIRTGPYADAVRAPSPLDPGISVKLGVGVETFRRYQQRGQYSSIAQYYGIVQDGGESLEGLSKSEHVFLGLKRPLALDDDMDADEGVLIYTWQPKVDFEWEGSAQDGKPIERTPPSGLVFAVLVRQEQPDEHGIYGSIERWNWIRATTALGGAPVDWDQRYNSRLWSRNDE